MYAHAVYICVQRMLTQHISTHSALYLYKTCCCSICIQHILTQHISARAVGFSRCIARHVGMHTQYIYVYMCCIHIHVLYTHTCVVYTYMCCIQTHTAYTHTTHVCTHSICNDTRHVDITHFNTFSCILNKLASSPSLPLFFHSHFFSLFFLLLSFFLPLFYCILNKLALRIIYYTQSLLGDF